MGNDNIKTLESLITIDEETYEVTANKIKVTLDNIVTDSAAGDTAKVTAKTAYAAITISKTEPTNGIEGDIWFKYN